MNMTPQLGFPNIPAPIPPANARSQVAQQNGLQAPTLPPAPPQAFEGQSARAGIPLLLARLGIGKDLSDLERAAIQRGGTFTTREGFGNAIRDRQQQLNNQFEAEANQAQQQFQNELRLREDQRAEQRLQAQSQRSMGPGVTPYQQRQLELSDRRLDLEEQRLNQQDSLARESVNRKRLGTVYNQLDTATDQAKTAARTLQVLRSAPNDLVFGPGARVKLNIDKARAAAGDNSPELLSRISAGEAILANQNLQFVYNSGPLKGALSNMEGERITQIGAGLGDSREGALFKAEMQQFNTARAQERLRFIAQKLEGGNVAYTDAEKAWEKSIKGVGDDLQEIIDRYTQVGNNPASPTGTNTVPGFEGLTFTVE